MTLKDLSKVELLNLAKEKGIEVDKRLKEAKIIELIEAQSEKANEDEPEKANSIIEKVQQAKVKQVENGAVVAREDVKQEATTLDPFYVKRRGAKEYDSVSDGTRVLVSDRLGQENFAFSFNKKYILFKKGKEYTVSDDILKKLLNLTVRVKTQESIDKQLCCGQAQYEQVALVEVLDE